MKFPFKRPAWSLLLCLPLLAACVSQPSVVTRYYILSGANEQTMPVAHPAGSAGLSVEIAALNLPRYLQRPQIVTRPSPQRLEILETHRWGDNLQRNIERVLSTGLMERLNTQRVVLVPHLLVDIDYRLLVDVLQFEAVNKREIVLHAQWTLLKPGQQHPKAVRNARIVLPLSGDGDIEEIVQVMSNALDQLAIRMASSINEAKGQ